jgi:glycosyltransferase involved in cell wall biosynthesis
MNNVLIVGLDTYAQKNVLQLELGNQKGYRFDVMTNDFRKASTEVFRKVDSLNRLFIADSSFLGRCQRLIGLLRTLKYNHAELYTAGRMSLFYLLILKFFQCPVLVVERGDVGCLDDYDVLTKFVIKLGFRCADAILYKEYYMRDMLVKYGAAKLHFLPNCVKETNYNHTIFVKNGGYLWANRIIPQRRCDWLVKAFLEDSLKLSRLTVIGFNQDQNRGIGVTRLERDIIALQASNMSFGPYQSPDPFYLKHTFFCLPSTIVFGNNALLEAMSFGLIPIVTEAPGVEELVTNGVNGIVTACNERAYLEGIKNSLKLSSDQILLMSAAAKETVKTKYSPYAWGAKLETIYQEVGR